MSDLPYHKIIDLHSVRKKHLKSNEYKHPGRNGR